MPKKLKLLAGDHSPKWYLLYSAFAALVIIGFFCIFSYYSLPPKTVLTGLQTAEFSSVEDIANWKPPLPSYQIEEPPIYVYLAVVIVAIGTAGFVTTKYFYEKNNKRKR